MCCLFNRLHHYFCTFKNIILYTYNYQYRAIRSDPFANTIINNFKYHIPSLFTRINGYIIPSHKRQPNIYL